MPKITTPRKTDTNLLKLSRALRAVSELDRAELVYLAERIEAALRQGQAPAPDEPDLFR